ncbi:uncharacterized protein CDAR_590121 [Caerostris darwini]|uniref:Uncharacterized protein n=1 Tax=Caerostris darwini TaxID=1538125 RepID=A0AAV4NT57_9ARAC|nr:uncharacterized protein CDAR_590121 [Caerostris darwini]
MDEPTSPGEKRQVTKRMVKEFNINLIRTWKPASEIWAFKFGDDVLGIMNAVSGAFVMHEVRKHLKLRPHVRGTCYIPVTALAYTLTDVFHSNYISRKILERDSCSLCITTKAGIIQAALGVAYPLIISPIIGFYMADKLLTYPIPSIHRAPQELFYLWMKIVAKNRRFILVSSTIQIVAAALVTFEKQSFFFNFINMK